MVYAMSKSSDFSLDFKIPKESADLVESFELFQITGAATENDLSEKLIL